MGIYTRKKSRNGLRIISYSTVIIFIIAIFSYYYFKPNIIYNFVDTQNTDNKLLETSDVSPNNIDFDNNKNFVKYDELNKNIEEFLRNNPKITIDFDNENFVKYDQLDKNIEEFIRNNPGIIFDVLRDFQSKQNQIEQKKISNNNLTNIEKIYASKHTMFIGNINADKKIFEFVDYNCGYCLKFHNEIKKIVDSDQSLQLVIIQMPILGSMSDDLSKLALAASLQNKFEEVHNYLYSSNRKSKMDDIIADLFLMNIDLPQLELDLKSEEIINLSSIHKGYVNDFKFSGTPAIIIGNSIIPGFIGYNKILEILEKEFS
ncbi:thioredoxin domain-containing protein [Alphaproteobacteria bacterium]|nr:thioredoxin domain-containing protein [Alphaproteobacteria bacterium]